MTESNKNYVAKNFEQFYSEIGKTFWRKDSASGRPIKTKVTGNETYHYTKNNEVGGKDSDIEEYKISYKLNSKGFRSDEFNESLSKDNYLYAGCSYTFGTGVPLDFCWAAQLNKSLGKQNFFNLGVTGGSTHRIIVNVLNYIKSYGSPKGIFILFPDLTRTDIFIDSYRVTINTEKPYGNPRDIGLRDVSELEKLEESKKFLTYERLFYDFSFSILNLEMLCEALDIDLFWGAWDNQLNEYILDSGPSGFKNYVDVLKEEIIEKVINDNYEKFNQFSSIPHWDKARDGNHPGIKQHSIYGKIFLDYLKNSAD